MKVSVIVPVYNVEGFLRDCLGSVVDQQEVDLEIICVEDCSTDNSRRLLRELAQEWPLKLVELERNGGLANARNVGLTHVTGDYVMFLDSDDRLEPGLIKHLVSISDGCDMAVFNHYREWRTGRKVNNLATDLLRKLSRKAINESDVTQKLELFSNLNVAWNKFVKKDFIDKHDLKFDDGYYEDIPFNYKSIVSAEKIIVTPFLGVAYFQRQGSILNSKSSKHKDLTLQYRRVYEYMINVEDSLFINKLDQVFVDHLYNMLTTEKRGRLTQEAIDVLGNEAKQIIADFSVIERIKDSQLRRRLYFLKAPLLRQGMLLSAVILKRKGRNLVARVRKSSWYRKLSLKTKHLLYKHVFVRLPLRNIAIFESYWGKSYACNPKAISEYMSQHTDIETIWFGNKQKLDVGGNKYAQINSLKYFYYLAVARYTVNNANFPNFMVRRKGVTHLQTKHGTPIKSMGFDELKAKNKTSGWFDGLAKRCERWDYVISSNHYSSEVWRKGFPFDYKTLELGYPRNDVLVKNRLNTEYINSLYKKLGLKKSEGQQVLLYMPTFRSLKESELQLDVERLSRDLGDSYLLLVRGHYLAKSNVANSERIIDVSDYEDVNDLYLMADLLLSDYSSCIFDYACLKRPIVLYVPDEEEYASSRGMYMTVSEYDPGVVCRDYESLVVGLKDKQFLLDESQVKLDSFYERFASLNTGESSREVVEAILND